MSFTDFEDMYQICCDWNRHDRFEDVVTVQENRLSSSLKTPFSHTHRWWEAAEKEIYEERGKMLIK